MTENKLDKISDKEFAELLNDIRTFLSNKIPNVSGKAATKIFEINVSLDNIMFKDFNHTPKLGGKSEIQQAIKVESLVKESIKDYPEGIEKLIEKAEKYNNLMTHTKYHNTFGCQFHFDLKEERRRNQFLQSNNVELQQQNQELKEDLQAKILEIGVLKEKLENIREWYNNPEYKYVEDIDFDILKQILDS